MNGTKTFLITLAAAWICLPKQAVKISVEQVLTCL